ncbi:722_t:CDS:2 [Dentiscutata erythropus]|uniref:722_t:CDS:1 n=1 Tax=Dentiscutata erythropus TaxID=1348616 RepID=A0A9N9BV57_9GLOM|nr:722_t:CDS:2 [Dentiscutata erythropus]
MKIGNEIDIAILKDNNELGMQSLNKYYRRAWRSLDFDYSKLDQHCDFLKNKFLNNDSFNDNEKTYLLAKLGEYQEKFNLINQKGKTRKCEDCHDETYSVQNCEKCIQNYLSQKFNTWTSGVPPYMNKKRDINLALAVVKGMRPKIDYKIPRGYAALMEQCWDANPENRPDISTVWKKIRELRMKLIEAKDNGISEENFLEILPSSTQLTQLAKDKNVTRCSSDLYILTNLSEPKNTSKADSMELELSVPEYDESEDEFNNESKSESSAIYPDLSEYCSL